MAKTICMGPRPNSIKAVGHGNDPISVSVPSRAYIRYAIIIELKTAIFRKRPTRRGFLNLLNLPCLLRLRAIKQVNMQNWRIAKDKPSQSTGPFLSMPSGPRCIDVKSGCVKSYPSGFSGMDNVIASTIHIATRNIKMSQGNFISTKTYKVFICFF